MEGSVRYAVIENQAIANIIVAMPDALPDELDLVDMEQLPDAADIGWVQVEGAWQAPTRILTAKDVDARRDAVFAAGFTPATGPLAGKTLQVRGLEDRTNWLTSQASYAAAVDAGAGDVIGATFRTAANETIHCSFADGLATLLAMAAWGQAIMSNSWAMKDALDRGEPIDLNAGWP